MKIVFYYKSPDTDEPNKIYESIPIDLKTLLFDFRQQIDFTCGSYLMLYEMEEQYTRIELILPII